MFTNICVYIERHKYTFMHSTTIKFLKVAMNLKIEQKVVNDIFWRKKWKVKIM